MTLSSVAHRYLPNPEQELLLKAALLSGPEAVAAWQTWIGRVDLEGDYLDMGSYRTLPMLHKNLRAHGVDHPALGRFLGIRRRNWYENQVTLRTMTDLLQRLHQAGIPTMILKGAALAAHYYADYGLRPMQDFDVLVPYRCADEVIGLLQAWGWAPNERRFDQMAGKKRACRHAESFRNEARQDFDLHWHLLYNYLVPDADDEFWSAGLPITVNGVATRILDPADQLLHICAHGAAWNRIPSIRWVVDGWTVLSSTPVLDWERLLVQTQRCHVVLALADTLGYLKSHFDAPVPPWVIQALQAMPVSNLDFRGYEAMTVPDSQKGMRRTFWRHYSHFYYSELRRGWLTEPADFLRFLMCTWQVDTVWQAPWVGVSKYARRLQDVRAADSGSPQNKG